MSLPPPTRYQGSKRKLCPWIWSCIREIDFETALDGFGGTGSVAYMLKRHGKKVIYNDILPSNEQVGIALIENDSVRLSDQTVNRLLKTDGRVRYPSFIAETFGDIYFTDCENKWLDRICRNISVLKNRYEKAIAWYALFQAALAKRPYNLFHRKNLYMRTADVNRSFGNKKTWDTPFEEHFRQFVKTANNSVFRGDEKCQAISKNITGIKGQFDLVYLDPPYINNKGTGVPYGEFYHFLDGMLDYTNWEKRIDWKSKHRRLVTESSPWTSPSRIHQAFEAVFKRFSKSTLVISYRSDGIPSIEELVTSLRKYKKTTRVCQSSQYKYVLSNNGKSKEVLVIGQ